MRYVVRLIRNFPFFFCGKSNCKEKTILKILLKLQSLSCIVKRKTDGLHSNCFNIYAYICPVNNLIVIALYVIHKE